MPSLYKIPEAARLAGRSKSALYLDVSKGLWPHPVAVGARGVAVPDGDLDAMIQARIDGLRNC